MAPSRIAGNLRQFGNRAVRQHFSGAQVAGAPEIIRGVVQLDAELRSSGVENLDGLPNNLRTSAVATDYCNVVAFHVKIGAALEGPQRRRADGTDAAGSIKPRAQCQKIPPYADRTTLLIYGGVVNFWWKTCSNLLVFLPSSAMPHGLTSH